MATILVTGTNRGIGLELCRQLKQRGDEVIAVCRKSSAELDALGVEVVADIDVTSDQSVQRLAEHIGARTLDVVINNAGLMTKENLDDFDFDRMRRQYEVNTLGPLRVAVALRERFSPGAKLAFITSRMGSITDNTSGGSYGYRMSKAALNMGATSLARDLAEKGGISVALLHPGWVRTEMTGGTGHLDASESAAGLIARIDELTLGTSGTFWHTNGEELPW